ncbi:MAG: response regulator [Sulfuricurvum sp.]|nr:response regulator [Sulfuricurvum sp.]
MINSAKLTVLFIENKIELREKTTQLMREDGLRVLSSDNTLEGCNLFRKNEVDIIMIDQQLPDNSGINFIRCLRDKEVMTPVIITTKSTDEHILLEAINLDITRYLLRPCAKEEIIDALEAAKKKAVNCHPLTFTRLHNKFSYDPINKTINRPDGSKDQLSKKEYLLLELLIRNKNQIISYDVIAVLVWQDSFMSMDALRTLVHSLRKKTYKDIIENCNGLGYKMTL